ncbi:hypothetical protein C2G38_2009560 [Gigaspora rosea]|uniref:Uncharacterized protein n=1 Tax=Gigaspora rosea TaxID=44941 RepID=A0A397U4J9_9GLOM|nr:hypothetical protein C2G38_2009560 [Gigaspora rosea]
MNECLDAEAQSRPTAKVLCDELWQFYNDLENGKTVLYKQIEEIRDSGKNPSVYDQAKSTRFNYQTHKQAIYASRSLDFSKLPKPINAGEVPDV